MIFYIENSVIKQLGWSIALLILFLILPIISYSQQQPLSRNDQAQIEKSNRDYEEAFEAQKWNRAANHLNDIANLYWDHNDYRNAIKYFENSLELNKKISNENGIAMIHGNLGMLYSDITEYDTALEYFEKTLAARRAFKNKEGIIAAQKNLSVVLNNLGRYEESVNLLDEALTLAKETNDPSQVASCALMLSETYEKAGDVEKTKQYYESYQLYYGFFKDKQVKQFQQLADEETLKKQKAELEAKINRDKLNVLQKEYDDVATDLEQFDADLVEMSNELDKKQLQLQFLETEKENQRLESEKKLQVQKNLRNLFFLGAIAFLLISYFIYRNYRQEQKSKNILATKNEQINAQNQELEALNKIIAKHNKRMQKELDVGREIQMSMIPPHFPTLDGVDLFATLKPAREVGGDLYEYFKVDKDNLIFGIGDVSDKGVPAALFMAVTKTLVKTNANYSTLPGKILTQVNKEISADNESGMFVTYFLCLLNTRTGELTFSNAGHNPPLFLARHSKLQKLAKLHGPVLGAIEDFEYGQDTITMNKGEQLVLFTDGVTEAMDDQHKQYSNQRLDKIFTGNGNHNSKESVEAIIEDVNKFRGDAEQSDDITILSIIYTGK